MAMRQENNRKRIRLVLQYDGTNYCGWQVQPDARTIQGVLEEALVKIDPESSRITAAGRTDAGVHAMEQIACFSTKAVHPPHIFQNALNAQIPKDIRIVSAEYCSPDFHPRFDAIRKSYLYIIHEGHILSPFLTRYCWSLPYSLNVTHMREAAAYLMGKHDFSSFRATGCGARSTEREIYFISVSEERSMRFLQFDLQGNFMILRIEANAFLRHMVRNITGTLVEIGRGKNKPGDMAEILSKKNRAGAGPTAPPEGLFLEKVLYKRQDGSSAGRP